MNSSSLLQEEEEEAAILPLKEKQSISIYIYTLLICLDKRRTGTNASDRQLPIDAYGPKKMLQVCAAASPRNNS
jgi:hypothetical protein